jgi:hypothetical protein
MSSLKDQLIRLGSTNPELRPHIRPVLDRLSSTEVSIKSKVSNRIAPDLAANRLVGEAMAILEDWEIELLDTRYKSYMDLPPAFTKAMGRSLDLLTEAQKIILSLDRTLR